MKTGRIDLRDGALFTALVVFVAMTALPPESARAESGCRVHDSDEVLETRVRPVGDGLEFRDQGGRDWVLVTSPEDPAISHKGSGTFHPAPEADVLAAIAGISFPGLEALEPQLFLLPYPRRDLLPSSTADGAIYLSPGVYPYASDPLHALVVHEMGHLVHQRLLPDGDVEGWNRYRAIRGLMDGTVYHEAAVHANRPREIFAEDFRALFGGARANYSGAIENPDLPPPDQVPGLREFFLALLDRLPPREPGPVAGLTASPNPFLDETRLARADGSPLTPDGATLDIVDAGGRLVRRLSAAGAGSDSKVGWNGRDDAGRLVPAGVYFARLTSGNHSVVTKLTRLP